MVNGWIISPNLRLVRTAHPAKSSACHHPFGGPTAGHVLRHRIGDAFHLSNRRLASPKGHLPARTTPLLPGSAQHVAQDKNRSARSWWGFPLRPPDLPSEGGTSQCGSASDPCARP